MMERTSPYRKELSDASPLALFSLNPADALPWEIFTLILSLLPTDDLRQCMNVSTAWNLASNDNFVWDAKCRELWSDKYVPTNIRQMRGAGRSKVAYFRSIEDSKREYLTKDELCDFEWNFRFKSQAGAAWMRSDPWWHGREPTRMKFHQNGVVIINPSTSASPPVSDRDAPSWLKTERRWRFIQSAANRSGPEGSFVQVNSYPPYIVSRFAPNWGFIMQSCWVVYSSFAMPPKGECPLLEDHALDITVDEMRQEAMVYNLGVQAPYLHNLNPLQLMMLIQTLGGGGFPAADDEDENEDEVDDVDDPEDDVVDDVDGANPHPAFVFHPHHHPLDDSDDDSADDSDDDAFPNREVSSAATDQAEDNQGDEENETCPFANAQRRFGGGGEERKDAEESSTKFQSENEIALLFSIGGGSFNGTGGGVGGCPFSKSK